MITYPKLSEIKSVEGLDKIDVSELKFLWYSNWFDGFISGMVSYQGEKCWVDVLSENDGSDPSGYYRRYLVFELSPEQLEEIEYWYKLFVEKVGSHTTFDENGIRHTDRVRPRETHHEFSDAYKNRTKRLELSDDQLIGYFEDG